ncbi:MAG: methylated-DNA--[protein]-cysteine S-methyltransferase [Dysgonamonadaceae bacterium]|jgi:AraC family transcriptional regulator of adaptative response/methylated-DNA-[protein]-cysteine methyltransferase|nr:methylated-DNA--[protein]-cysteine S-methyltransferase [Dysgonamonadaceae bacterium]
MQIELKKMDSPIGLLNVAATAEGICWLDFADKPTAGKRLESFAKMLNASISQDNNIYINELEFQLKEYFEGKRKQFTVKLFIEGTPFQKKVWAALQAIPYGSTHSYKEQSAAIGMSKAVRAVANANGANPISIVVPCHRVIGSNGQLTGYGGGLWRKKFLLELETANLF